MLDVALLESEILSYMDAAQVPGLAVAVVEGEEVIYAQGFGVTSVEDSGQPVTPETVFLIGSVTKPLTGTAIMRLVEQNRLELDRPISDYVPWFRLDTPGGARSVTLRMLLSHTSGLPSTDIGWGAREPDALEAFVRNELPKARFVAPPGKLFHYSNLGLTLAGYLAEIVSKSHFSVLMQELVFAPLGMRDTTFGCSEGSVSSVALPHERGASGGLSARHRLVDNVALYPAGLARSTVLDLANFARLHLGGSSRYPRLLSSNMLAEMHRPQVSLYTPASLFYGLTFYVANYKGVVWVTHPGVVMSYAGDIKCVPNQKVAVVTLRNFRGSLTHGDITGSICDKVLSLPVESPLPRARPPARSEWRRYVGSYLSPSSEQVRVEVVGACLILHTQGRTTKLLALKDDVYFCSNGDGFVGFVAEGSGLCQHIVIGNTPYARIQPKEDTTSTCPGRDMLTYARDE